MPEEAAAGRLKRLAQGLVESGALRLHCHVCCARAHEPIFELSSCLLAQGQALCAAISCFFFVPKPADPATRRPRFLACASLDGWLRTFTIANVAQASAKSPSAATICSCCEKDNKGSRSASCERDARTLKTLCVVC